MSTTDTRAKLETLFRRLTDPTVSDLDALADFVWFRKLALDAKDVSQALGAPAAPTSTSTSAPSGPPVTMPTKLVTPAPGNDGPMWPFTKRHVGESIAHIARTDPDYLRYMLKQGLYDPLHGHVEAALTAERQPFTPTQPKVKEAK